MGIDPYGHVHVHLACTSMDTGRHLTQTHIVYAHVTPKIGQISYKTSCGMDCTISDSCFGEPNICNSIYSIVCLIGFCLDFHIVAVAVL